LSPLAVSGQPDVIKGLYEGADILYPIDSMIDGLKNEMVGIKSQRNFIFQN
jgi:hypothetical protein